MYMQNRRESKHWLGTHFIQLTLTLPHLPEQQPDGPHDGTTRDGVAINPCAAAGPGSGLTSAVLFPPSELPRRSLPRHSKPARMMHQPALHNGRPESHCLLYIKHHSDAQCQPCVPHKGALAAVLVEQQAQPQTHQGAQAASLRLVFRHPSTPHSAQGMRWHSTNKGKEEDHCSCLGLIE